MNLAAANETLARARAAQPAWAARSVAQRCRVLAELRLAIARQCESIAGIIARETAKPLLDALSGDVMVTLEHLRFCEAHAHHALRPRRVRKPAIFFRGAQFAEYREPHGVVLIFAPANYPFQLSAIPLTAALAAGNAVVLKCSERAPETAALLARICAQANMPSGLVQVLHDDPGSAADLIDARPDLIFFTGSSRNGQQVAQRAARYLIPTILELGGKDASVVFADCHLDRAVEGITYGAFANAGRVCVAVKRAYVEAAIYDRFLAALTRRVATLRMGHGADVDLLPFPGSDSSGLRGQVEDALARGAKLHWPQSRAAIAQAPVILTDVPADARILTEESFGAALCVAPFHNEAEAVALANASPFALSGSIWTRDRARARRVALQLAGGACAVNDVLRNIANPYASFGGNRASGYGRYRGAEGLRAFTRAKTVMIANDRRKTQINWFPFTSRTTRQLAGLLRFRHGMTGMPLRLSRLLLPLLLGALLSVHAGAQAGARTHLTIDVRLTPAAHGELGYLIFASPDGFPGQRDKAILRGFLPIPARAQHLLVQADLPPGTYAVSVYDDLNGNHKLDHNFMGIPREPVGASNNPPPRFGPPRFDECSFRLGGKAQTIGITLVHGL